MTAIFILFMQLSFAQSYDYRAEIFDLSNPQQKLFDLKLQEQQKENQLDIQARFLKDNVEQLVEKAIITLDKAEIVRYEVNQLQTKEKGLITVEGNQIKIEYTDSAGQKKNKTLNRPDQLVAPANFEHWLEVNFKKIEAEKTMVIDFLVWDRLDLFKFKVSYLGLQDWKNQKVHQFKMNLNNPFLATFISPIKMTFSQDMKKILLYEGRVAVKQGQGPDFKNLDGKVEYFHQLKASQ